MLIGFLTWKFTFVRFDKSLTAERFWHSPRWFAILRSYDEVAKLVPRVLNRLFMLLVVYLFKYITRCVHI
jgi:hypothetical protein